MALVSTSVSLNRAGAEAVLIRARSKAEELDVPVCIAVVDAAGTLIAFERMDGAARLSIELAQDKAYTVTAFGKPTRDWYPMIKDDAPLLHGIVKASRLMIFGGGVPVMFDGQIVGAIGISGGTAEQDHEIAEAGAAAAQ